MTTKTRYEVDGFDRDGDKGNLQAFTSYVYAVSKDAAKKIVARRRARKGRRWIRITGCKKVA